MSYFHLGREWEDLKTMASHMLPEISGQYFISGEIGKKDHNFLPEYLEICPAYGVSWAQLYKKTERTIGK